MTRDRRKNDSAVPFFHFSRSISDQGGPPGIATSTPLSSREHAVAKQRGPHCEAVRPLLLGKIREIIAHFGYFHHNTLYLSEKKMHAQNSHICNQKTFSTKSRVKMEGVCKNNSEFLTLLVARRNYSAVGDILLTSSMTFWTNYLQQLEKNLYFSRI